MDIRAVDSGYFAATGIAVVQGRAFTDSESLPAIAISEEFARVHFRGEDPIGKTVRLLDERLIVGMVADSPRPLNRAVTPQVYVPYQQLEGSPFSLALSQMFLRIRTSGEPLRLAPAIRRQIAALHSAIVVFDIATLEQRLYEGVARPRFYATMLGLLAAAALAVAWIGVYGVVAYSVRQRTREIAIRIALGAQGRGALWLVLRQSLRPIVLGLCVGWGGGIAVTRLVRSSLFGLSPFDSMTFAITAFLLGSIASIACYLAARRVAFVDPMVALRFE